VFNYLSESFYDQVGKTACADYRHLLNGYWNCIGIDEGDTVVSILLGRKDHWAEEVA
jgi:hypothetical protein